MIDPSINLKKLLKGRETALWGARVSQRAILQDRKKAMRGTLIFTGILIIALINAVYENRATLFFDAPVGPAAPTLFRLMFLFFMSAVILIIWYAIRSLKTHLKNEQASIFLITDERLIAADQSYNVLDKMPVCEIETVFTTGSKAQELFVTRKNDPDSEHNFYMALVPDLDQVKPIIEQLAEK